MTSEDFARIKPGDNAITMVGSEVATVAIDAVSEKHNTVKVRRIGKTGAGRKFPLVWRHFSDLRLIRTDALSAHVYADWLEERGQQKAADLLRSGFPLEGTS